MPRIDQLDSELLTILEQDARLSIAELAERLGVSRNTVQARLRRLSEAHLLQGFSPRLNLVQSGIEVEAFIALTLEQGKLYDIAAKLADFAEVMEVHTTTGREDLLVRVGTVSHADLQALIQQIVALPGVSHSDTKIALTNPLPFRLGPLLGKVTRHSGWGRSTALPEGYRG